MRPTTPPSPHLLHSNTDNAFFSLKRWSRSCFGVVALLVITKLIFSAVYDPTSPIVHHKPCVLEDVPTVVNNASDYSLAYRESLGFFDDIPAAEWELQRAITMCRVNTEDPDRPMALARRPPAWYQKNWDPDFSCRHEAKIGVGDGGKWVCDPHRLKRISEHRSEDPEHRQEEPTGAGPGCLIYSVGSEGDFRFELGLQTLLQGACEIHTFDFTDFSHKVPPGIHFHQWGLKPSYKETKGTSRFNIWTLQWFGQFSNRLGDKSDKNFKTFEETLKELGHEGRPIDIFKIDCEGCEWSTYKDWIDADIRQLLVEVHMVPEVAHDFFTDLQNAGYVTFHKEPNIQYGGGIALEYGMLKLSKKYVQDRQTTKVQKH